jgi:hypothetical protein
VTPTKAAAITCVLHLLALALAVTAIAPGSMAGDAPARAAYLASRPLGWTVGWSLWMASAIAFVLFLAAVARRRPSPETQLAVVVGMGAAAIDLATDTLQITVRPLLAAEGPTATFRAVEVALDSVGFVAANGLYSCAVLVSAWGLGRAGASRLTVALGASTFAAGLALAGAGFGLRPQALQATAGLTMLAYIGWVVAVARDLRSGRP